MRVEHDAGQAAFLAASETFLRAAGGLDDRELLTSSHCRGWTLLDVLVHVHLGLQEMLLGVVAPTGEPPDVDAAGYWRATAPPTDDLCADQVAQVRFVRLLGAASAVAGRSRRLSP